MFPLSHFSILGVSYNRPQLDWNISCDPIGSTFANNSTVGSKPHGIFIDNNDTFYYGHYQQNLTLRWTQINSSINPNITYNVYLPEYTTLFVTLERDIYFEKKLSPGQIQRRSINGSSSTNVTNFNSSCYGIFIDINNTLYCSLQHLDKIEMASLNGNPTTTTLRAATGVQGNASNQLHAPWGIFVNINFDLYVADAWNNRIQLFPLGKTNGTTVAGRGTPTGLSLNWPTDIILDGNDYLYIADNHAHRIILVTSTSYRCLVGCSSGSGSGANQLNNPYSLRFDSYGNLYVAEENNARIQKFVFVSNCPGKI